MLSGVINPIYNKVNHYIIIINFKYMLPLILFDLKLSIKLKSPAYKIFNYIKKAFGNEKQRGYVY